VPTDHWPALSERANTEVSTICVPIRAQHILHHSYTEIIGRYGGAHQGDQFCCDSILNGITVRKNAENTQRAKAEGLEKDI
jgi:hypothetical protein